jgi:hypothetical protein
MAGTQREAGAALGVVLEKGVFGLRTECFLQSEKNSETKPLRISQDKWIFSPKSHEK